MKIGTVVIGQHFRNAHWRNGQEGVIIDGEKLRGTTNSVTKERSFRFGFRVRWSDTTVSICARVNLRPKHPPSGEQKIADMFKHQDCFSDPCSTKEFC